MLGIKGEYWQETLFGALGAALSVWLLREAAQLPERSALFPTALLWCLLVVSLLIALKAIYTGYITGISQDADDTDASNGLWVPAVMLIGTGALLAAVGFYFTALVVIFAFHALHGYRSGESLLSASLLRRGLLLAVLATLVMYLVFDVLIGLPAPSGTLF